MERLWSYENKPLFSEVIKVFPQKAQAELIQLENGLRLVAEITVTPSFRETMEPGIKALEEAGLTVVSRTRERGITEYYVSKVGELAQEAFDIQGRDGDDLDHRRFGELMGFPSGSIESFVNDDREDYLEDSEIEKILGFENNFFQLQLSRTNLDESIRYLKDSYKALLEQAPHLIEEDLPVGMDAQDYKEKIAKFVYQ